MNKRWVIFFCLPILCCLPLFSLPETDHPEAGSSPSLQEQKTGLQLIDALVIGFNRMALARGGDYQAVNNLLQKCMADFKQARSKKLVDDVFCSRYLRILEICKLIITEQENDREGILNALISREIQQFIYQIHGRLPNLSLLKTRGIGSIAAAMVDELVNLVIYLDTKKDRNNLMKKHFKFPPPPPPSKKKK